MCASDFSFKRRSAWASRLAGLILALVATLAHAQADKDAEQLKRLRLQLRQMQQQQQQAQEAQAQADRARQQAEQSLQSQAADLASQRVNAASASRRSSALGKELEALRAEHEKAKAELATLKQQHDAAGLALKASSAREASLTKSGLALSAQLQRCGSDNVALAELGLDILQRYENKGMAEVLSANEPFVQTGRVKLENLKADYQRRIDAARFKAPADDAKATGIGEPAASPAP